MKPFTPRAAATVNIDVSSSSQAVKVCNDFGEVDVLVTNDGTATAWIAFGVSGVTAAAASAIPIPAGTVQVLRAPQQTGPLYAAAIAAGSTGKVYFTPGSGL